MPNEKIFSSKYIVVTSILNLAISFNLLGSCEGPRINFSITELLNHDIDNHHIFTCKILETFVKGSDFESIAVVQDAYVGNPKDTVYINTGGNTLGGGGKLYPNSIWLIFSTTVDSLHFNATSCDFLSTQLSVGNNNCGREVDELGKVYLDVLDEYRHIKASKYSGAKQIFSNGRLVAEGSFKSGSPQGNWTHYCRNFDNDNRLKKSEITYSEGKLDGKYLVYHCYDNNNIVIQTEHYKNDLIQFRNYYNEYIENYEYLDSNKRKRTILRKDSTGTVVKQENYVQIDYNNNAFKKLGFINGYYFNKLASDSSNTYPLAEGYYEKGARIGLWKFFNKKGEVVETKTYPDSLKQTPKFQTYNEDGKLRVNGNYENGKRTGIWEYFWRGNLETIEYYDSNGDIVSKKRFYSLGGFEVVPYKNNKMHGPKIIFRKDSLIRKIENYKAGNKDGISIYFDEDGSIAKEYNYINSRKFTIKKSEGEPYYYNGYANGFYTYYIHTMKKTFEGQLWNGYRTGVFTTYGENGNYSKQYYQTDKQKIMNSCGHNEPIRIEVYNKEGNLIRTSEY